MTKHAHDGDTPGLVDLTLARTFEQWRQQSGADSASARAPVVPDEVRPRAWTSLLGRVSRRATVRYVRAGRQPGRAR